MKQIISIIQLLIVTIFWGSGFIFGKISLTEITAANFVFLRYCMATISLIPFLVSSNYRSKINLISIKYGFILGLLQYLVLLLQMIGLETLTASLSGFLIGLSVVFIVFIQTIFQKKKIRFTTIVAICGCLSGLYLLSGDFGQVSHIGLFFAISAAFVSSIYFFALDHYSKFVNPVILALIQMFSKVIYGGLFMIINKESFMLPTKGAIWIGLLVCGIGGSSVAYYLQNVAQKNLGILKTSLLLQLQPIFSAIFAKYFLNELINTQAYIGMIIMVISIVYINICLYKHKN